MTFAVGVIYGPSGCGKTSLVKAGLLPKLAKHVNWVYVEATADETEKSLLEELRKKFPQLPQGLDLSQTIVELKRRSGAKTDPQPAMGEREKAFIVLDQFEQWLHAKSGEKETALVRALRQCDGDRVQVLVSVRDDFLSGITEFMRALKQHLHDGQNSRMVRLFELGHAKEVLAAFGRAHDQLPEDLTPEQDAFLDEALAGLSQGRQVLCVRLALFAQMFKDKAWTSKSLKDVGGTEGVGETFLEETFCAPSADKRYSDHKDAAIAILKALLPGRDADIKGPKRSSQKLLEASRYQNRPEAFADLLRLLDSELGLISLTSRTAAGSNAEAGEDDDAGAPADRYYQLTHDYLVPSLRQWLRRKLQETRQGQAYLLLESRCLQLEIQQARRSPHAHGAGISVIRMRTNPRDWAEGQRRMMQHARNVHLRHAVVLLIALPAIGLAGLYLWGRRTPVNWSNP